MNKVKAFLDATGAFFRWCWQYPTTPLENFRDAKFRYDAQTNPAFKKAFDELEKTIIEHLEREKKAKSETQLRIEKLEKYIKESPCQDPKDAYDIRAWQKEIEELKATQNGSN